MKKHRNIVPVEEWRVRRIAPPQVVTDQIASSDLYYDYVEYCKENDGAPCLRAQFSQSLSLDEYPKRVRMVNGKPKVYRGAKWI